jgi:hypothetical protein
MFLPGYTSSCTVAASTSRHTIISERWSLAHPINAPAQRQPGPLHQSCGSRWTPTGREAGCPLDRSLRQFGGGNGGSDEIAEHFASPKRLYLYDVRAN